MTNDPSAFFRDMLGQWEKMANQFGTEALKSEGFARGMGGAGAATMAMQSAFQQSMEKALAAANLPSRRDFDELAARIDRIEASIARIETTLGATPPRERPKPTRKRKPPKPETK